MDRGRNVIRLKFPLDALTLEADKFRLISAIKEKAPADALHSEFIALLDSNKAPTYTQLWLDDMQSFRRRSVQELPPHSCLQDGRYTLLEKIATGGQAKIYKAFDRQRDCNVALKELILPINAGAEVRNRSFANVKKEATLVGSLNHPGILKLLDNFVEDHRAYIVLEFIEGKTLRQMVQSGTAFDPAATVSTAIMIAEILAHLHGQSPPVVHRDIAPDNLMQAVDGRVVLLDFNVAQQLESNTTKTVVGKHNYMAPEQFKGKPTTQSDLYSLGCTLYFLLTAVDPRPLSCSHPGALVEVPSWLDEVVGKLTALDSSQRFATAEELLCELRAG